MRRDFATGVALLTSVLLLAGTSLFVSLRTDRTVDLVLFAFAAALLFVATRVTSTPARTLTWLVLACLPFLAHVAQRDVIASTLFSPDGGFLSLYPVTYIAVIGTLAYATKQRVRALLAFVLLAVWAAFGANLSAAVAVLAPGLAFALEWARRRPIVAIAPIVAFAVVWNYWLMVQYTVGLVPKDAPVSFAAMVRQQADVHTAGRYVYPLAFPGNVWFAWRQQVPVDRYDLLSSEGRGDSFALPITRGAERFLLEGWGPPGTNDVGPFRWADGPVTSLTFPFEPSARDVDIEIVATARGEAPAPAVLTVSLNGHVIGRLHVATSAPTSARLSVPAARVGRVLRAGYNRLSLVPSGQLRLAIHHVRVTSVS